MPQTVEVFADITCPFTHVGLKQVVLHPAVDNGTVDVIVRAWPLEWVNGVGLDEQDVAVKARVLSEQLGVDDFSGMTADQWPASTIPALNLAAIAYERDNATGLAVSMELRAALFEQGLNVGDPEVLATIAAAHDLAAPAIEPSDSVRTDYEMGVERGVAGSPHFWVAEDDFFCPSLDIGHDDDGTLTARFDSTSLAKFFDHLDA